MEGASIPSDDGSGGGRMVALPRSKEEAILAAFGDSQSRAILLTLGPEARSAQDLVELCALPQASVYRKLRELQEGGLVGIQRSVMTSDGHRTDLFRSLVSRVNLTFDGGRLQVRASFRELAAERMGDLWDAVRQGNQR